MERILAVVGGSGLYDLPGLTGREEIVLDTPFGRPSDVIVRGTLAGTSLLFLPRHARGHRVPPHRIDYRSNFFALKKLGAQQVVSVSAVGSMKEAIEPGHFVVVDQFVDWTRSRPTTFFDQAGCVVHVSLADPVDAALSAAVVEAATEAGAVVHRGGTYLCIEGPQFSTRAESLLFRSMGVDVIGMTNAPEYRLAREAELPYASIAMATDYDCWHSAHEAVTVDQVVAVMAQNADRARETIVRLISKLPDPRTSPASHALDSAIVTSEVSAVVREHLSPLLDRVLRDR